jgi:hypothetical protein
MPSFKFIAITTISDSESDRSESPESPTVLAKRQQIQSLRDAISHKQPVVFGTSVIPADQWTIFYGKKGNTEYAVVMHSVFSLVDRQSYY